MLQQLAIARAQIQGAPSWNVARNQGAGKTLSVLLFRMLNTMLNAYLEVCVEHMAAGQWRRVSRGQAFLSEDGS